MSKLMSFNRIVLEEMSSVFLYKAEYYQIFPTSLFVPWHVRVKIWGRSSIDVYSYPIPPAAVNLRCSSFELPQMLDVDL